MRKYVGGRPPTTCEEHDPKKKRTARRKAKAAKKPSPAPAPEPEGEYPEGKTEEELERAASREVFRRAGSAAALASLRAYRPQMLAVHLRDGVDPETAAALAGVTYDDADDLAELVDQAAAFSMNAERSPQALAGVLSDVLVKGALRAAAGVHAVSIPELMRVLPKIAETVERLVGRSGKAYTHLGVVYEVGGDDRWDPRELLPPELRGTSPLMSSTMAKKIHEKSRGTTPSDSGSTDPTDLH